MIIDEEVIRSEIEQGVAQVDDTLTIDDFSCIYDNESRNLKVLFTAKTADNETISVSTDW